VAGNQTEARNQAGTTPGTALLALNRHAIPSLGHRRKMTGANSDVDGFIDSRKNHTDMLAS
jgi:hypothetical protein